MTKRQQQEQNNEQQQQQSPLTQRGGVGLSPQRQQEQAIMLEPFYERLIGMTFDQSTTAIERCRDLCAEFGFTVKQEASTHRNIYVYCSREGLPDSLRNPKSNPQRKRPSKRCDCRWRVVLYENEDHWEFRKSLNPEAGKHNHELMRPEEIERSWPKEVTTLICELARLRMTTQEIRNRVRAQFPNIHWNERRFYNRLSEERQKIKTRDSAERTQQLSSLWGKVCMATAGNDDLSEFVKQEMIMLFQSICDTVQIDPQNFPSPLVLQDTQEGNEGGGAGGDDTASTPASTTANNDYDMPASSSAAPPEGSSKKTTLNAPKGYLPIEIPKQIYYIKIHNQRQLHETQLLKNARKTTRSTFNTDQQQEASSLEPPRKISRKGKARQSSSSSMLADTDHQTTENNMQLNSPLIPQPSFTTNSRSSQAQPTRQQEVQQQQQQPTQFVYYESSSPMPLDSTALSNYVHHQHQSFQNPYTMSTSSPSSTPNGFNTPTELTFSFDSSSMSGGGNNGGRNNSGEGGGNSNSNEPTIHPALQSAPMSHQQQQKSHQQQQQRMYTTNKPSPPQQQQQQMRIIYESPKDGNNNSLRSLLPDNNNQQSYQQQRQQQGMYNTIRPSSPRSHHQHHHGGGANTIMPMYPQQQQQQQQQHPSQ